MMTLIALWGFAYLVGAVPTTYLIAKAVGGIDLRSRGSGNVGASNLASQLGKHWFPVVGAIELRSNHLSDSQSCRRHRLTFPWQRKCRGQQPRQPAWQALVSCSRSHRTPPRWRSNLVGTFCPGTGGIWMGSIGHTAVYHCREQLVSLFAFHRRPRRRGLERRVIGNVSARFFGRIDTVLARMVG